MSESRIRVVGKPRREPDLQALARGIIELARLLDQEDEPDPTPPTGKGEDEK